VEQKKEGKKKYQSEQNKPLSLQVRYWVSGVVPWSRVVSHKLYALLWSVLRAQRSQWENSLSQNVEIRWSSCGAQGAQPPHFSAPLLGALSSQRVLRPLSENVRAATQGQKQGRGQPPTPHTTLGMLRRPFLGMPPFCFRTGATEPTGQAPSGVSSSAAGCTTEQCGNDGKTERGRPARGAARR